MHYVFMKSPIYQRIHRQSSPASPASKFHLLEKPSFNLPKKKHQQTTRGFPDKKAVQISAGKQQFQQVGPLRRIAVGKPSCDFGRSLRRLWFFLDMYGLNGCFPDMEGTHFLGFSKLSNSYWGSLWKAPGKWCNCREIISRCRR